ncbi:MAG: DUF4342 domain-containing protein [Clostridiales bacterium]|nr:DUF4342 domain-containing protein [Clostridiales bacterium]
MVTLDQVEKLRQRANVSYDEAKIALEEADGDILEAIISLEKKNRIKPPVGGGYYNSQMYKDKKEDSGKRHNRRHENERHFKETIHGLAAWIKKMVGKGNRNHFEVVKNGENIISIPVTILAIALIFAFWVTLPLAVVGLFFGFRYTFNGPDLGKDSINKAMGTAANAAENLKKEFKGESDEENSNS